ncbi:MAG TPA: GAF domain-containing sensor histidine kinase [Nocardioidaceae bacterium]|nr:GAF domain-containing sensor histidine kinase [Nocardioidaceae bacterium]
MTSDEESRTGPLQQYAVLTEQPGRDLQALTELAAQIFGVPKAVLNIISDDNQHQIAAAGFEASVCAREDSMCAAVLHDSSPVIVGDASGDERFSANPFVTGDIGEVRFYASAPLVMPDGFVLGRLCVFDEQIREATPEQSGALQVLAERVVDVLELRLSSRKLERSLAELTQTRDELRRSNERLSQFAGQISHDLRTPLTVIVLNAEVARSEPAVEADPHIASLLDAIVRSGTRMADLVDRILENARVGGSLTLQEVDLGQVVDDALHDLEVVVQQRSGRVDVGTLPKVSADRSQLYSVLLNLLTNAVKFTAADRSPHIAVRAIEDGDFWRIEVTDNGVGVAPENRTKVFEMFAREEAGVAGTGIGLATVKEIVTNHGGTVGLEPGPDGGTTVWFTLPR